MAETEFWAKGWPYGLPSAYEMAGGVAAPLLAGFSLTLVGFVFTNPADARWPRVALVLLVAATVVFLMAVQAGVWVRAYTTTPDEVKSLWPEVADPAKLRTIQRLHREGFRIWSRRFLGLYRIGILLLLGGLAVALVPRGDVAAIRWAAVGVAVAGCVAELLWIASGWMVADVSWAIGDTPDVAPPTAAVLKRNRVLRRFARAVIPLVRVDAPPPVAAAAPEQPAVNQPP